MSYTQIPRLVLGAPHGHSGKTTIAIGLVGAMANRGYKVQPFKKGADYIDPSWLSQAAGRTCRNLDCFWFSDQQILQSLITNGYAADISVIEGAMGLFDGMDIEGTGSTAQIAKITKSPVLLVVDCTRMTRSIAPLVQGFMNFDSHVQITGIILNKIARPRHESMLRAAIKEYCGIPVLGALPKNPSSLFPERHLGLIPAGEDEKLQEALKRHCALIADYVDLERVLKLAQAAEPLPKRQEKEVFPVNKSVKIGVIRDQVFSFYYPENLEELERAGAELVFIDSLRDQFLPAIEGLYIGGGFPEIFAEELVQNAVLRQQIAEQARAGLPIYAECGGLMYLGKALHWEGRQYPMCGVFPYEVQMEKKPQGHGYSIMSVCRDNPFWPKGTEIKGHEFHHSRVLLGSDPLTFSYQVKRGFGMNGRQDGVCYKNTFAAYHHVHALAYPEWADNFVKAASYYKKSCV